jgi:ankyrin repeat protein
MNTPLHLACSGGFPEVVSILLDAGADMEISNEVEVLTYLSILNYFRS